MQVLTRYIDFNTTIEEAIAVAAAFGTSLFLGCAEDYLGLGEIPVDRRIVEFSRDEWSTALDPAGEAYNWCQAYFGQAYKPDSVKIGRVVSADSAPYTIVSGGSRVPATYAAQAAAKLKFVDSDAHAVTITVDFTGVTSFTQVLAEINSVLDALNAPAIPGLDSCVFGLDAFDRLYFSSPTAVGADARTITLAAATLGGGEVDLFTAAYLGNAVAVYGGTDAETLLDAYTACRLVDDAFYQIGLYHKFSNGAVTVVDADVVELAETCASQAVQLDVVIYDTDAKDSQVTDDLASGLYAVGSDNLTWYYTEHMDDCPDAANNGFVYPQKEGACSFAFNSLALVSESGDAASLTTSEIAAIRGKGGNYVDDVSGVQFVWPGLVVSGKEKRLVFGAHWFDATNETDVFNARIARQMPFAYDWNTFGIVESIIRKNAAEAAARKILYPVDDKDYPFVVTMPDPASISSAIKASHEFNYSVYTGTVQSEILRWQVQGKFKI